MRTSECSPSFKCAFALHSVYLGAGVVGGPLLSMDDLGRDTANVAIRLLDGAPQKHQRAATWA